MKTYARVKGNVVQEIIKPLTDDSGEEIEIALRFSAEFVTDLVDVTDISPLPNQGWTYDGATFTPDAL